MRFNILTAVKISMLVFWVVTPCGLVGRYHRFRGTYCLSLQPTIFEIFYGKVTSLNNERARKSIEIKSGCSQKLQQKKFKK
jgi:hypothetical protein